MAVSEFGILKNREGNNLRSLHVELRERVRRLFALAESTGLGELMVYSAARTHAHQTQLYKAYLARGRKHPVVANPDRKNSRTGRVGSAHMVQPSYKHGNLPNRRPAAFAVDIQWRDRRRPSSAERDKLKELAASVGLVATVSTEWWHFEPALNFEVFSQMGFGWNGDDVRGLQQFLNNKLDAGLFPDGDYGPKTYAAVARYQKLVGHTVSGDWTRGDHYDLIAPQVTKPKTSTQPRVPSKEPPVPMPKRTNRPAVDGVDRNPTQYQTNRLVRQRAIEARNQSAKAVEHAKRSHELATEIAKLIHHEQND